MLIQRIRCDTIEEFFVDQIDWEFEYLQLSPGGLDFRSTVVNLPGVQLYLNTFGKRMKHRELFRGSTLIFGFVADLSGGLTYRGHEFSLDYAQIQQPGCEHEYVIREGLKSVLIYVDTELVDLMGWTPGRENVKRVARSALRALEEECRRVAAWAAAARAWDMGGSEECLMRDRILVRLEVALGPWLGKPGTSVSVK